MAYEQNSPLSKKEALQKVAELSAERYHLQVKQLEFLSDETNFLYKVIDSFGDVYALKIFEEEYSSLEDNLTEIFFMDIVNKTNHISAPRMIPGKDGEKLQVISSDYTSTPKYVSVYSWLDGEELEGNENDKRLVQLGELTAHLHNATYGISVPTELTPKMWNEVFYFKGEQAIYKQEEFQKHLSKEYHQIMDSIIPYLNNKLSSFYKNNIEDIQLIHGDLNPFNIKVQDEQMHIIDFADSMLGLPIHDLSIMLYYYKYNESLKFDEVKKLYFEGYRKIRDLPEVTDYELDLFMTARRVSFLNYILEVSEDPTNFIERNISRVKDFLKKYNIKL
ncbi:phosphotransferase [Bacillus spongiae]|uniref:Phosphotransferase n=1 Tax=Bacillus spongiae TaxID=2683610 RepID=A0ABU8H8F4_9BACI